MTRWARRNIEDNGTSKRAHDPTSWQAFSEKKQKSIKKDKIIKREVLEPDLKKKKAVIKDFLTKKTLNNPTNINNSDCEETDQRLYSEFLKKNKKREDRRLKRQNQKSCFKCRQVGHKTEECVEVIQDNEHGTGICYKCGSTEHSLQQCHVKLPPGNFPFAKCFICREKGHISSQCPDNPRGLYPNGGCCHVCSSVEHYKKDCPEKMPSTGLADIKLETISHVTSADEEPSFNWKNRNSAKNKPSVKIVKF